jgi:exodeoxyribonuclease VII small subunit
MAKAESPQSPSFTEAAAALEDTLSKLKSGNTPLEESLTLFEQGVANLKVCQTLLNGAKGKVDTLVKTLGIDGEIVTDSFDD